jgi:hypothetical protein
VDPLSSTLTFFWVGLPLAATGCGVASLLTGEARWARWALAAFVANILSIGLVFFAFVPGAVSQADPASEATILAGALAEALNGSCLAMLGLPGGAIGVWALYRERSGTLAS